MPTYYVTSTSSDLSPSWTNPNADYELETSSPGFSGGTLVSLSGSSTGSGSFITKAGDPNSDSWEDGGSWSFDIEFSSNKNLSVECRAVMLDSSGTILQSGSFTSPQTITTSSIYSFTITAPTWTATEACGNRIAIEFRVTNSAMSSQNLVFFQQDSGSSFLTTDITKDNGTCGTGSTFVPKTIMF